MKIYLVVAIETKSSLREIEDMDKTIYIYIYKITNHKEKKEKYKQERGRNILSI